MLRFRAFHNSDPPLVTALWRSRQGMPGFEPAVTVDLLEQLVFGKPYFDYAGLILAWDDERPIGLVHASFGPAPRRDQMSTEAGVVCLLLSVPDQPYADLPAQLLAHAEAYLCRRGAKVLYGGGLTPLDPFYLGLYGGSVLPGVLDHDPITAGLYPASGYEPVTRTLQFQRDLTDYRPPVDRELRELRRRLIVEVRMDPPYRDWWEACTLGDFDLTRFELLPRGSGTPLATATVRAMQASGPVGFQRTAGLVELWVDPAQRRQGLGTFLVHETMRSLAALGVSQLETQATSEATAALHMLEKADFHQVSSGTVYRKAVKTGSPDSPAIGVSQAQEAPVLNWVKLANRGG